MKQQWQQQQTNDNNYCLQTAKTDRIKRVFSKKGPHSPDSSIFKTKQTRSIHATSTHAHHTQGKRRSYPQKHWLAWTHEESFWRCARKHELCVECKERYEIRTKWKKIKGQTSFVQLFNSWWMHSARFKLKDFNDFQAKQIRIEWTASSLKKTLQSSWFEFRLPINSKQRYIFKKNKRFPHWNSSVWFQRWHIIQKIAGKVSRSKQTMPTMAHWKVPFSSQ